MPINAKVDLTQVKVRLERPEREVLPDILWFSIKRGAMYVDTKAAKGAKVKVEKEDALRLADWIIKKLRPTSRKPTVRKK